MSAKYVLTLCILVFAPVAFCSSPALAVPPLSIALPPLGSSAPNSDQFTLGVLEESFLDRAQPPRGHADSTRLSAQFRTLHEGHAMGGALEVGGSFDTTVEKQTSIEVPQAYLRWSREAPELHTELVIGRKLYSWSELDSYWTLGIWQPLNRFDGLRPSEQGLMGAFGEFTWPAKCATCKLVLFASPIFIPEQGPSYELQDGHFVSNNAWFAEPTDRVVLLGADTPITYRLETPAAGSVIQQLSGGFQLQLGNPGSEDLSGQIAFAKKPRNQLSLPFSSTLVTGANPEGRVTIFPQVAYHNVASAEIRKGGRELCYGLSALADVGDPERIPAGLTWQEVEPLLLLSPSVEFQLWPTRALSPRVRFSTLHTAGGAAELAGQDANTKQNPFASRLMYKRAASVELRTELSPGITWRIESGLRLTHEFTENGTILVSDIRAAYLGNWQLGAYIDLLASNLPVNENPGFISRFRGNDRAGVQVGYIF